ncbi:MAG: hypothetical protein ACFFAN_10805 [Promethearchaeota archaeon]
MLILNIIVFLENNFNLNGPISNKKDYNVKKATPENQDLVRCSQIQYQNQSFINGTGQDFLVNESSYYVISGKGNGNSTILKFFVPDGWTGCKIEIEVNDTTIKILGDEQDYVINGDFPNNFYNAQNNSVYDGWTYQFNFDDEEDGYYGCGVSSIFDAYLVEFDEDVQYEEGDYSIIFQNIDISPYEHIDYGYLRYESRLGYNLPLGNNFIDYSMLKGDNFQINLINNLIDNYDDEWMDIEHVFTNEEAATVNENSFDLIIGSKLIDTQEARYDNYFYHDNIELRLIPCNLSTLVDPNVTNVELKANNTFAIQNSTGYAKYQLIPETKFWQSGNYFLNLSSKVSLLYDYTAKIFMNKTINEANTFFEVNSSNDYVNWTIEYDTSDSIDEISQFGWYNPSWAYRKKVLITEPGVNDRYNAPIDTFATFPYGRIGDAAKEIRVTDVLGNEIPCYVYNETYSGFYCISSNIIFLSNLSKSETKAFYIYYGNSLAPLPSYNIWTSHTDQNSSIHSSIYYSRFDISPGLDNWTDSVPLSDIQNDNDHQTKSLPFNFKYFDQVYSQIELIDDGYAEPFYYGEDWPPSHDKFKQRERICAIWDDYDPKVTPGFDVFEKTYSDRIIYTWDTRTYSGGYDATFQIVLYKTGDIMLRYGNAEGFSSTGHLAGISKGDNSNYFNNTHGNFAPTAFYQYSKACNYEILDEQSEISGLVYNFSISIPKDWQVNKVFNDSTQYDVWENRTQGSNKRLTIINASKNQWQIECNSQNYKTLPYVQNSGGIITDTVLFSETVFIKCNFTAKLSSGYANLTIYPLSLANYKDSVENIDGTYNITFTPWNIDETASSNATFIIQVIWFNGTEIGVNTTLLIVEPILTELTTVNWNSIKVDAGTTVITQINFTETIQKEGISDATIYTNWTEDQYLINDFGNGLYNISFYTEYAIIGKKNIQILASKNGFQNGTVIISFNISGLFTNLNFVMDSGVNFSNGKYWMDPAPFPNDQQKKIRIYFNDSLGNPIAGGTIKPRLNITQELFIYIDLGNTINHTLDGYYDIIIDTLGLHEGDIGMVNILASKEKFISSSLNLYFKVIRIDCDYLSLETDPDNYITAYIGDTITIGASFVDLYHNNQSLFSNPDHGYITWSIPGTAASDKHIMTKIMSIYFSEIDLSLYNIKNGTYDITIETCALQDYNNLTKNITLLILPKTKTFLEILIYTSDEIRVGKDITIATDISFSDDKIDRLGKTIIYEISYSNGYHAVETRSTDGSGIAKWYINLIPEISWIDVNVSFEETEDLSSQESYHRIYVLPRQYLSLSITSDLPTEILVGNSITIECLVLYKDSKTPITGVSIEFYFSFEGIDYDITKNSVTNSDGEVEITVKIPNQVENAESFKIYISFLGEPSIVENEIVSERISILTVPKLILRYSPIWLPICIGSIISVMVYNWKYRLPKKKHHIEALKQMYQRLSDSENIQYILVLSKNSGIPISKRSVTELPVDDNLLSGFLSAISSFGAEIGSRIQEQKKTTVDLIDSSISPNLKTLDRVGGLQELSYGRFKIILEEGEYVKTALLLLKKSSNSLWEKLRLFTQSFEETFKKELINFSGEQVEIIPVTRLIEKIFEIHLLYPHQVIESKIDSYTKSLSKKDISRKIITEAKGEEFKLNFYLREMVEYFKTKNIEEIKSFKALQKLKNDEIIYAINPRINELIEQIIEFIVRLNPDDKNILLAIMDGNIDTISIKKYLNIHKIKISKNIDDSIKYLKEIYLIGEDNHITDLGIVFLEGIQKS